MKLNLLAIALLFAINLIGQQSLPVHLKITYKGNPLCNWELTMKNGGMTLASGKTDDKGEVQFGNINVVSKSVDLYGFKKIPNGDKKWEVKGYIQLKESGITTFEFKPLVDEMGMPAMIESAWGLTLNDCVGNTKTTSQPSKEQPETKNPVSSTPNEPASEPAKTSELPDPRTSLENQKVGLQNKVNNLDTKIKKKESEIAMQKEGTKEWSALAYDIEDMKLEKEITQIKAERIDAQLAKGGTFMLSKSEKEPFDARSNPLEQRQKELKANEKKGIIFGQTSTTPTSTVKPTETPQQKTEEPRPLDSPKSETKSNENKSEEEIKIYNSNDLSNMSVAALRKHKLDCNTYAGRMKLSLKSKGSFLTPPQKEEYQRKIDLATQQVELVDAELSKRNEKN